MNDTDDALTEAVAKDMYEEMALRFPDDVANSFPTTLAFTWDALEGRSTDAEWWRVLASRAIAAVRTFDEQAALNCGHCTPNTDEIACGCIVQSREDSDE